MKGKDLFSALIVLGMLLGGILLVHPEEAAAASQHAVVCTYASDWSSGAHDVAWVDPIGKTRAIKKNLLPTISDIQVAAYGRYFYRIERYSGDNITKFDIAKPSVPIWQFSTLDTTDTVTSNPLDIVFASATKAYVIRNNSTKAWIVNPNAKVESKFKIGELDLSAYADSDGLPEMQCGVVADGKFFLVLQRLNRNKSWVPSNTPYLAVFDVKTGKEIKTNSKALKLLGIPLPIKTPRIIQYLKANDTIYISGYGTRPGTGNPKYEYTGGIVTVNPKTYKVKMLLNDGTATKHPYGAFWGMSIASKTKGYFVGYTAWGNNTLYKFNPTTGKVLGKVGQGLSNINIAGYDSSVNQVDKNKMVWISDATNARVVILNTVTDKVDARVKTGLNPARVVFVSP